MATQPLALLCAWQEEHDDPTAGTVQCPKCRRWFCEECAETFLDFAMIFGQKAILPLAICAQCHYEFFELKLR